MTNILNHLCPVCTHDYIALAATTFEKDQDIIPTDFLILPFLKSHDCFIMKILKKLDMAGVFLGTSPIANVLLIQIVHYAVNYHHFLSSDLNATYHLGDDQEWKNGDEVYKNKKRKNFLITRESRLILDFGLSS